jgi:hypothetical protein
MRVMVFGPAAENPEADQPPTEEGLAEMMAFSEELIKAGILLDRAGLLPTSEAKRARLRARSAELNKS